MKRIHYDTNQVDSDKAKIIGIYDDIVHGENIPSPVVEVDEATWRDIIENNGDRRRVDVNTGEIVSYTPPPKPEPVPATITFRQTVIGAVSDGWITEQEGETWLQRNGLPTIVQGVIDALPSEQQFAAKASALDMTHAYRSDPFMVAVAEAAMPNKTEAEISDALDTFFRTWSQY